MEEVARLFGTHRNTVRAWLKAGLRPIDGGRPALVLGNELRRFLDERRVSRKQPTPPGMIYCMRCRQPRRPAAGIVDFVRRTSATGDLQGICPDCELMLYRRVSFAALASVKGDLDVTIREEDLRLLQCRGPSVNHDSRAGPGTDADAQS